MTFKATDDYGDNNEELEERCSTTRGRRIPAALMSSTQLLFVPDLSVPGTYRAGGISGVTRSLGASTSLIPGLSALPSLSARPLAVTSAACLILATDGLWDTFGCSPEDLIHFFNGTPNREFAKLLTARAIRNGSSDNVTILVVWLDCPESSGNAPLEVDLASTSAYPTGTRCASVPTLGDLRLRGPLKMGVLGETTESALPRYIEPQERVFSRSHSAENLAHADRIRASSPMRLLS